MNVEWNSHSVVAALLPPGRKTKPCTRIRFWSTTMVRRLPISTHGPQLRRSNSSLSQSLHPAPAPLPVHLFQACRNPAPAPSLLRHFPVERPTADHRKSRVLLQEQRISETHAQTQAFRQDRGSPDTCGGILQRYVGSCDPLSAQSLHLELIKSGFSGDLFLSNTLVNLYAKWGKLLNARQVLDEMPTKNTVSWTCLISGYVQSGQPDEACDLFHSMLSAGFLPTEYTIGSVLHACQDSGPRCLELGTQVHGLILKTGYSLDPVACNALISMYGCCRLDTMLHVYQVFESTPKANLISWNSIISVCSQRGDVVSAYELFLHMRRCGLGLSPNEYTFGSLISVTYACPTSSASFYLCLLDQVLSQIIKSGFMDDLYVGSSLVSAFARFGVLEKAKKIFLQMGEINAISMNGLMVGLVKRKQGEEAVEVFRETGISASINCDSYVVLLSACAEFSIQEEGKSTGKEIHGLVIRNGLSEHMVAIGNGLVNMYAKCGAIKEACKVFEHMECKDQVSWNSIISGLDQNGLFEEALISFYKMRRSGISPSNFTLISSLSSCTRLGLASLGTQLHCDGAKLGFDFDVSVSNALMTLYGECGYISECWRVFHLMPDHDVVSWNSMIGVLAASESCLCGSMHVFRDMIRNAWNPNRVTFINILAALSLLSIVKLGSQIHTLVLKHGLSSDIVVENALLSCYAKCGDMDACEQLFINMSNGRDNLSWNSMVAGYVDNGLLPQAMDFVWLMVNDGQKLDHFTFATVLNACASVAALERGMEMHAFCIRSHMKSDVVVESALVDMYSKCGRINYATNVFRSMALKNEFSYNAMISGYARHGHADKALKLFNDMQEGQQQPDHVTFVGVLSACSHVGLVEQGLRYFDCMSKEYGIAPRMEHYSCMVDLLGRAGKLDKMESFLNRMPMKPNVVIWRTVLAACCRAKDDAMIELGKQAGKMLLELEQENPVNYILISKLFASRGYWEDVAKARSVMRDALVKKDAGCSWVTMKDGIHVFTAGDRSHPDMEKIYVKLSILIQKTRDAGYVPQTKFVLYDLDMEDKEELLTYHSEKLAVAFVLTHSSGLPIRIMKNLRVCGDCHSFIRYISKITGREIILRDSIRFHHFENGNCSCGDYW